MKTNDLETLLHTITTLGGGKIENVVFEFLKRGRPESYFFATVNSSRDKHIQALSWKGIEFEWGLVLWHSEASYSELF